MKIFGRQPSRASGEQGSALLVSIVIAAALGLSLAGYLSYVNVHTLSINRSQHWNSGVPIVESGIEEAMTHMNYGIFGTFASNVMSRWDADGWQVESNELHSPLRELDGSTYTVRISTNRGGSYAPEIICLGRALTIGYEEPAAAGPGAQRILTTNFISRQVRVRTQRVDIHAYGLLAESDINLKGHCTVDAFNSATTNSWYGHYDERFRTAEGTIASIGGNIDLGAQGVLYGTNYTSATGTTNNGTVGDAAWIADEDNEGYHQDGHYRNDLNTELQPVPEPTGASYGWPSGGEDTYTEPPTGTNVTEVTTPYYPSPPPPDGNVTTNATGAPITTLEWPSHIHPDFIKTNSTTATSYTYPTNATGVIITNEAAWHTNLTFNLNSPAVYPQSPATNISPLTITLITNLVKPGPSEGTYLGTLTESKNHVPQTNPKQYTYTFDWIYGYKYFMPESYTFDTVEYSYTNATYTYLAPSTNSITVTREFKYILDSTPNGYYEMSYLTLSGSEQMLVRGNAVLWVTGQTKMSGQSQIIILPGASLTLYAGGDVDLSGQGILNKNYNALNLTIFGLEGCTDISLGGNAEFTGTIYAPFADFKANGGGNSSFDIVGAITAKTITLNGHFNVHYDANLRDNGRVGGYVVRGWFEERVGTP